ncbi:MAG: GNAT family N-acetyltransferase [Roseburia sp.]|nr:GNAT family N-acetyltransferase [Roseburia sp.]
MAGTLKYVLYRKEELLEEGRINLALGQLFRDLMRRDIVLVDLCGLPGDGREIFQGERDSLLEEALLITARDDTLNRVKHLPLAVLAYRNPEILGQELYGTDFLVESFAVVDFYFLERVYQRKHGIPWRVIDTRRCYLREITLNDLPDLYRLYQGEGITDFVEPLFEWQEEVEYTKAYIEKMYPYFGYGMWLVMDKDTNRLMGRAGLNPNIVNDEYLLEMGYIIDVKYQRKGYGLEVCQAILEYAKEADLGFEKVYCFVVSGNAASLALLHHLEFVYEREEMREGKAMLRFSYDLRE